MRAHQILQQLAGDHGKAHGDSFELHMAFATAGLFPSSVYAEVEPDDAQKWALFCFAFWTLTAHRRPNHVANELASDGVNAWTHVDDESFNVVQWLEKAVLDLAYSGTVSDLQIDQHNQVLAVNFKDGGSLHFRNRYAAQPWTEGAAGSFNPDHTTTFDNSFLFHMAALFGGHVVRQFDDESAPRGELKPLVAVGHKYKT